MAETHSIDMQMISESSSVNRGLLLSFMLFAVYILVTVAATTDRMLLVPSTVKLPLANIDIPLFGFFIIAPLFMIALHFNLLVHLQQHAGKVRAFLKQQSGSGQKHDVNLPPFMFNYLQQFQPGHLQHHLLFFVLYVMVVLFPAAVLLYAQFKFSKYHSWAMTGWHYGVLLIELYVIRLYWPRIVHQEEIGDEEETWRSVSEREKRAILRPLLQIIVAALILAGLLIPVHRFSLEWFGYGNGPIFSMVIQLLVFLSFAFVVLLRCNRLSESGLLQGLWLLLWQTLLLVPLWKCLWKVVRFLVAPFKYIFRNLFKTGRTEPKKSGDRRVGNLQGLLSILLAMAATLNFLLILALPTINRWDPSMLVKKIFPLICPRIVVREQLLVAGQPSDTIIQRFLADGKSEEKDWMQFFDGLNLEGRDLQFADLGSSRLFKVDFKGAKLQGAYLRYANLQGANLGEANLQGANLGEANLQGAGLWKANLQGAYLDSAELQDAFLGWGDLQGADLGDANLQGAYFAGGANLQGADLGRAKLQGANLGGANLQGADLTEAELQGAYFGWGANLQGAKLEGARLQGADLGRAKLQGANLVRAFIGGTIFSKTGLRLTNLQQASCDLLKIDDWKKLQADVANRIPEAWWRDDALKLLKDAEKRKKTLFDPPVQIQKGGAFYDPTNACFTGWPPTLYDKEAYQTKRVEYLADLACEDPSIAERLSRRAASSEDVQLAKALLEKSKACPDMKQGQEYTLNRLKELIQENQKTNGK